MGGIGVSCDIAEQYAVVAGVLAVGGVREGQDVDWPEEVECAVAAAADQ